MSTQPTQNLIELDIDTNVETAGTEQSVQNVSETEAASEHEGESTSNSEHQEKKRGVQRRISELTNERKAANEKAAQAEKRAAELEERLRQLEQAKVNPPASNDRPKMSDYDSPEDYQEAIVDWKLAQREQKIAQKQEEERYKKESETVEQTFNQREESFKKNIEDYDDIVTDEWVQTLVKKSSAVESTAYILESDYGPNLLFDLANDGDLQEEFSKLKNKPHKQVAWLAKREAKYEKEQDSETNSYTGTSAPPPAKTLPSGSSKQTTGYRDPYKHPDMSQREFEKWWDAQARKK